MTVNDIVVQDNIEQVENNPLNNEQPLEHVDDITVIEDNNSDILKTTEDNITEVIEGKVLYINDV